jgi:predicted DNA-binding WGR domain protein
MSGNAKTPLGRDLQLSPLYREAQIKLICTDGNSYKFYRVFIDIDGTVETCYGRIGTLGTGMKTKYSSTADAIRAATKVFQQKINKGYEPEPGTTVQDIKRALSIGPIYSKESVEAPPKPNKVNTEEARIKFESFNQLLKTTPAWKRK